MNFPNGEEWPLASFEDVASEAKDSIPADCRGCGVQCDLAQKLAGLFLAKQTTSGLAEQLVGESGREVDRIIDEFMPEESSEELKRFIRQNTGQNMDAIDESIDETEQEMQANALACSGVLKMRATKDDVRYTVSVCTSPRQYVRGGRPMHLPTHIQAEQA